MILLGFVLVAPPFRGNMNFEIRNLSEIKQLTKELKPLGINLFEESTPVVKKRKFREFHAEHLPKIVGTNNIVDGGWYLNLLLEFLEDYFDDFVAGLRPRAIIQVPPQHWKSTTITLFNAYVLEQLKINSIYTSYAERLTKKSNRLIRNVILPNMVGAVANANQVDFKNGSSLFTGALGGGWTGTPADFINGDDFYKGLAEARSETNRFFVEEAWNTTFLTRLSPIGGWILVFTRWHQKDLIGSIIAQEKELSLNEPTNIGSPIKIFSYPAIAKNDEYHPKTGKLLRKQGEALMPAYKDLRFLLAQKARLPAYQWEAVWQQNPISEGTTMIDVSHIHKLDITMQISGLFIVVDTAYKDKDTNDFTCFGCYAIVYDHGIRKLVLMDNYRVRVESDIIYSHLEYFIKRQLMTDWYKKQYGGDIPVFIEDKSSGITINQALRKKPLQINGRFFTSFPLGTEFYTNQSKQDRTLIALPHINTKHLVIASCNTNYQEYLDELAEFTINNTHGQDGYTDINNYALIKAFNLQKNK